ncbi:MAG: hypothetical protein ACYDBV_04945 [Nitrospiria bacterium]
MDNGFESIMAAGIQFKKAEREAKKAETKIIEVRPVHLALREIILLIEKFILLPDKTLAYVITFWVLGTYVFREFNYFGYLALRSATPRCGKSRLLKLISALSKGRPPVIASPTPASLFRTKREVSIFDEVDKLRNADKETYGKVLEILNFGFEKGGIVERVDRGKHGWQVMPFSVYGPKALAGIESLADTLSDRAFQIRMERTQHRLARLNPRKLEPVFDRIRQDCEAFGIDRLEEIQEIYNNLPDELIHLSNFDDRFQDISEPLIVLASIVDAGLPEKESQFLPGLIQGLTVAAGRREPSGREKELMVFIEVVESRFNGADSIFFSTADLLAACRDREELSRIETGRSLAAFLKNFDLVPGFNTFKTHRGYDISKEWVENWSKRYGHA